MPAHAYLATPTVRLNGQEHDRLTSLVTSMVMHEQEGGLSSLELRLSNSASLTSGFAEYAFDAGGELSLGAELVVGAGDATAPVEIFRGFVTGIEGLFDRDAPPELVVLAEDALQKARCRRRTRVFEAMSLADIARTIASDHGLTAQVDGCAENFGTQVQLNETDLGFLRRLLARIDADVQVVGQELHIARRDDVLRGELELTLGIELKSARVLSDLAHQLTSSTAKAWDVSAGAVVHAENSDPAPGPGSGATGSDVFSRTLGERTHHAGHVAAFNQTEVDALARTVRARRARQFLRIHGVTTGTPSLRVGTHATVAGLGEWFSNTYYVTTVRHRFDLTHGYRTEFEGQCAFLRE